MSAVHRIVACVLAAVPAMPGCADADLHGPVPPSRSDLQHLDVTQTFRLLASEPEANAEFGRAVDVDGETLVIGAPEALDHAGVVFVFERDGSDWVERQQLTVADSGWGNRFGGAVAVDGDTIVVGAERAVLGPTLLGGVFVYERGDAGWTLTQSFAPPDVGGFGATIALDGDTFAVGRGSVRVYERQGSAWTLRDTLVPPGVGAFDLFGTALAIDGDTILVNDWRQASGPIHVYERENGVWLHRQMLTLSQQGLLCSSRSLAISGNRAAMGLWGEGGGDVAIWERGDSGWSRKADVTPLAPPFQGEGAFVALERDMLVLAGYRGGVALSDPPGWAQVFLHGNDGWEPRLTLLSESAKPFDRFGDSALAASGNRIVVGASDDSTSASGSGAAYVFELVREIGEPCLEASQCESGFCVDGACCDEACSGGAQDCMACSVSAGALEDGHCRPAVNGTPCDDGSCQAGACVVTQAADASSSGGLDAAPPPAGEPRADPTGFEVTGGCACTTPERRSSPRTPRLVEMMFGVLLLLRRSRDRDEPGARAEVVARWMSMRSSRHEPHALAAARLPADSAACRAGEARRVPCRYQDERCARGDSRPA